MFSHPTINPTNNYYLLLTRDDPQNDRWWAKMGDRDERRRALQNIFIFKVYKGSLFWEEICVFKDVFIFLM